MSITVTSSSPKSISVTQGTQATGSVVIKKAGDVTLQGLSNVDSTDLQDGYSIIYDSTTKKWVTQQIVAVATSVDGGTY